MVDQLLDKSDADVRPVWQPSEDCLDSAGTPRVSLVLAARCPVPFLPRVQVHRHVPARQRRYKTIDDVGVPVFRTVHRLRMMVQGRKMIGFGLPTMASEHC